MLTEIRYVKQEPGRQRRWFQDDDLELIVWLDAAGGVDGFQLCYREGSTERALTWRTAQGFAQARVETGDTSPLKNQTPILLPDGGVPWPQVTALFRERSGAIEPALRELILARLSARS